MSFNNFTPHNIKISEIWLYWVSSIVAGIIGSVFLVIVIFLFSPILEVQQNFQTTWLTSEIDQSSFFPIVMSFFSFVASLIVSLLSYRFFCMIDSQKYKNTLIHYGNICFFCLVLYLCMAPIYIFTGWINYDNILIIFVIHILLLFFWVSLLWELLNNYRYILVWFYASFVAFLVSGMIVLSIFYAFESSYAKLLSLLLILPLANFLFTFVKGIFEYWYYAYYKFTWYDQLWDIFYQIEEEVKEQEKNQI